MQGVIEAFIELSFRLRHFVSHDAAPMQNAKIA